MNEKLKKPQLKVAVVNGSFPVKRFRRGKKFQAAYFEIGNTNQTIQNLLIEATTFERHNNMADAVHRRNLAEKLKTELKLKYDAETFDLDYFLPQVSGLEVKQSTRVILNCH